MNPTIITIATAFDIVARVIGVPAGVALLLYTVFRVRLAVVPPRVSPAPIKNPDAILWVLGLFTRVLTAIANVAGEASRKVFHWLALIAAVALILALVLYLTGQGLHAHREWARVSGGAVMAAVLVGSLALLTATRGLFQLLAVSLVTASLYGIEGIWRGFAG